MPEGKIVSDSTILIFLGKINKLNLLKKEFKKILIPQKVFKEVVTEGKKLGEKDAVLVEKAINEGWIEVKKTNVNKEIEKFKLEQGETEALSLAKKLNHKKILADEESVREAARILGIKPRGTLHFLFKSLKRNEINFEEFLGQLEKLIDSGFYIDESIYSKAIKKAKRISKK